MDLERGSSYDECMHASTIFESTNCICEDCGIILNRDEITYTREWRYYGLMDTKHGSDPNRCHARRMDEKTIFKDVEKMGFSDKIVTMANKLYGVVSKGKIYRGSSRKGIIFGCIFHSYKMEGNPQSCEHLLHIFQIHRKVGLRGLKFINLNVPRDFGIQYNQVSTETLILDILKKFHATEVQRAEVLDIYHQVKNRSSLLNRSRPQSVAAGVVRFYIETKNAQIPMAIFKEKVNLSELTICKLVQEITRIYRIILPCTSADDSSIVVLTEHE